MATINKILILLGIDLCESCGSSTAITPRGFPSHNRRLDCSECGHTTWIDSRDGRAVR